MHGTHVPGEQGGERWEKIFKEIIAIFFFNSDENN